MTMQITERDKKILIFGGIFVGLVVLIVLVLMPLVSSGSLLQEQIETQELQKQEKQMKVDGYPVLINREKAVQKQYDAQKQLYYSVMSSADIDQLMTGIVLGMGAQVENLHITMPDMEEYAALNAYTDIFLENGEANTQSEAGNFDGAYSAQVVLNITGTREQLQKTLDFCISQHPKQQVTDFSWQENKTGDSKPYSLTMTVNLYMCEDIETYIQKQEKAAAENAAAGATEEPQ